jgi:hypothetical protein
MEPLNVSEVDPWYAKPRVCCVYPQRLFEPCLYDRACFCIVDWYVRVSVDRDDVCDPVEKFWRRFQYQLLRQHQVVDRNEVFVADDRTVSSNVLPFSLYYHVCMGSTFNPVRPPICTSNVELLEMPKLSALLTCEVPLKNA